MTICRCGTCGKLVESRLMIDAEDGGKPRCVMCDHALTLQMLASFDGDDFMAAFDERSVRL